jgi:hypothetical protein
MCASRCLAVRPIWLQDLPPLSWSFAPHFPRRQAARCLRSSRMTAYSASWRKDSSCCVALRRMPFDLYLLVVWLVTTLPKNLHQPRIMWPQTNKNNWSQLLLCSGAGVQKEISLYSERLRKQISGVYSISGRMLIVTSSDGQRQKFAPLGGSSPEILARLTLIELEARQSD